MEIHVTTMKSVRGYFCEMSDSLPDDEDVILVIAIITNSLSFWIHEAYFKIGEVEEISHLFS